ncbi:hypothetical protein ScPMuIL_010540 [Solemya velum]
MWAEWWSYNGISGPNYWGQHNQEYELCRKGKLQSPINIEPKYLIYDPHLKRIRTESAKVDGRLTNTGKDITFEIMDLSKRHFNLTGGPFSYKYRASRLKIHFGSMDYKGSEHTVDGKSFPGEIQVMAFNSDLYHNFSEAATSPHGIAGISLLAAISEVPNDEFDRLIQAAELLRKKGNSLAIHDFSLSSIMPTTDIFITYDGSFTHPACHETVTWAILNKPMYITKDQLDVLRDLTHVDEIAQKVLIGDNFRPTMPLNRRLVRTNVPPKTEENECSKRTIVYYQMNEKFIHL